MLNIDPKFRCFSKAGKNPNEDRCFVSKYFAYAIDGATGMQKVYIGNNMSPAEWYVKELDVLLQQNLAVQENSIIKILENECKKIKENFDRQLQYENIILIEPPSAAIAIIRIVNDKIQYYILGDCSILVKFKSGEHKIITDNRVSLLDKTIISEMVKIHTQQNIDVSDTFPLVKDQIISQRNRKNSKEGYWILTMEGIGISHGVVGCLDLSLVSKICLLTDGFSAFYEIFHLSHSYKEFIDEIEIETIESMYHSLRSAQELDKFCNKYPRFKPKDDATLVLMKFT